MCSYIKLMTSIYPTQGTFDTFIDMGKLIKVISFKYFKMENFSPMNKRYQFKSNVSVA